MGRYLERAENTARLVGVNTSLLLDLPRGIRLGWKALIDITGTEELFHEHYQHADERNIVKFLLADDFNLSSISRSLAMARENARTTREIMPSEAWEQINNIHWYIEEHVTSGIVRGGRHQFLREVITACQQLAGLLEGTMSHDNAYNFIKVGRCLERADMTTRIVNVGSANLLPQVAPDMDSNKEPTPYENILWMNVLRSLSADQMYRQHVQKRINGEDVLAFLLQDQKFPRSATHCVAELELSLKHLPRNEAPLRSAARVKRRLAEAGMSSLLKNGLHEFIDALELELGATHHHIASTWFDPPASE